MPSRWTFTIPPIAAFIERHLNGAKVIVDPFAGKSKIGTLRNDLAEGGIDAHEFCEKLLRENVVADAVLFDPPYSPRQLAECYKSVGRQVTTMDTQSSALYARIRKPLGNLLKPNGIALSFGWNSMGFGKKWQTLEIMLVAHGGGHYDTICVAQRKPLDLLP